MSKDLSNLVENEPLLYRLIYNGAPRQILQEVSSKQIVALLHRAQQTPELCNFKLPINLESLSPEILQAIVIDVIGYLHDEFLSKEPHFQSSTPVVKNDVWEEKKLPKNKHHWLPLNKLLAALDLRESTENFQRVRSYLSTLLSDRERIFDIAGKTGTADDIVGFYKMQSKLHNKMQNSATYYTNPRAILLIKHELGIKDRVLLPDDKQHWISLNALHKAVHAQTADVKSLLSSLLDDATLKIEISGHHYAPGQLIGYFHKPNQASTYYVDPIIVPFIKEKLVGFPALPKDEVRRLPVSEMAARVLGNNQPAHIKKLKAVADELLRHPETRICPNLEFPAGRPACDLMGYYTTVGTLYFHADMERYLKQKLQIPDWVPDDRKHFLSEHQILVRAHIAETEWSKPALKQLINELQQKTSLHDGEKDSPPEQCIGFYRRLGRGNSGSYHVTPNVVDYYLNHDEIADRAAALRKSSFNQKSEGAPLITEDKKGWLPLSLIARKLSYRTPEARKALQEVMRRQYEAGAPHIGWFRNGPENFYNADPASIGTLITREMVEEQLKAQQSQGPAR